MARYRHKPGVGFCVRMVEEGMPDTIKSELNPVNSPPDRSIRGRSDPVALSRLLDEWMQGDEAEQRETFQFLRQALDEQRPAGYKLFS